MNTRSLADQHEDAAFLSARHSTMPEGWTSSRPWAVLIREHGKISEHWCAAGQEAYSLERQLVDNSTDPGAVAYVYSDFDPWGDFGAVGVYRKPVVEGA